MMMMMMVVLMMMMVVLMMAPERAESPSCRQQQKEKRCFPASARTHQKYIILCLYPFIGCCVLGGGVQVRCPTNEGRGLQFTTTKILF